MFVKLNFKPFKLMINNYVICTAKDVLQDIISMKVQPDSYYDYMEKEDVDKKMNFLMGVYSSKICGLCFYRSQFDDFNEYVKNLKIDPIV